MKCAQGTFMTTKERWIIKRNGFYLVKVKKQYLWNENIEKAHRFRLKKALEIKNVIDDCKTDLLIA